MPKTVEIEAAIDRGLAYLQSQQQSDGGFLSFSSASSKHFEAVKTWRTTFVPALILASLAAIDREGATPIRERLATFLLRQKHAGGGFNYWARNAPEAQTLAYPDDLDDTFCALAALYAHNPALIDEKILAQTVKLLLATETAVGGPYRTWLVPADSDTVWLDVDVAVNANIAYFLSLIGSRLPGLDAFLDETLAAGTFISPYYPSPYPFVYYFSRAYQGSRKQQLLAKTRQLQRETGITAQDEALCLTARLRLGDTRALAQTVHRLLDQQTSDGAWPAAAFYADPLKHGRTYYSGCGALTTAMVIEALRLFQERDSQPPARPAKRHVNQRTEPAQAVLALAERQCRDLAPEVRDTTLRLLTKLSAGSNGAEIIGLPERFSLGLRAPVVDLPAHFLTTLSLANLYGWLAYTVYDDLLDGTGRPGLLPAANIAMRKSLACFSEALPLHRPYQLLLRKTFDTIDGANAWELAHCRFARQGTRLSIGDLPDYGDLQPLAERSFGHALAPLAILLTTGANIDSTDFRLLRQTLSHYLIARQLNDDLHDWEEDLAAGRITYVVQQLLADSSTIKPGTRQLAGVITTVRQQFWHTTLPRICGELRQQAVTARRTLHQITALQPANIITELLDGVEASVVDTLAQHGQAQAFLRHYGKKSAGI